MKRRIQLNPHALRHYRESRGLTRTQVADLALRKNDGQSLDSLIAMYGRLERSGVAGYDHANRIAKFYNVPLDHLLAPTATAVSMQEATLWFVSRGLGGEGEIAAGLSRANMAWDRHMEPLINSARDDDLVWAEATIDDSGVRMTFTHVPVKGFNSTHAISVRPMVLGENGYSWGKVSAVTSKWLKDVVWNKTMDIADSLRLAGKEIGGNPALSAFVIRQIRLTSKLPREFEVIGESICSHDAVLEELATTLRRSGDRRIELDTTFDRFEAHLLTTGQLFCVFKVELDDGEVPTAAPWPGRRRRAMASALKQKLVLDDHAWTFLRYNLSTKSFVEDEA